MRAFADQAGIDLVLRYNGEKINPEDRASVLQGVNRALVYHRGDLDITNEILDRLNRQRVFARPTRWAAKVVIVSHQFVAAAARLRCRPPLALGMSALRRPQRTISAPVTVTGFGFWSGLDARLEFRPAEPDTGIVFVREDLEPHVYIPASIDHRTESPRRTTLTANGQRVEMVEHVLAALAGLQIDNCEIATDAVEMPGVDGSSLPFATALSQVETIDQPQERSSLVVTETTRVGDADAWIEASPAKPGEYSMQYRLDYGSDHPIGRETVRMKIKPAKFMSQLAPARTFIMQQEAEWLRQQGLGATRNFGRCAGVR